MAGERSTLMQKIQDEMDTQSTCIRMNHVDRCFGKKQVLFDISFEIPYAQIFGILGPSGSGKTTLVKMVAGVDEATNGEVYVLNHKMPKLAIMKHIGYMAQADALYGELTAEENLRFFASMYKLSKQKIQKEFKQ